MAVLASLGGWHFHYLARASLQNDEAVLAQGAALHWVGGRGARISTGEVKIMVCHGGRLCVWKINKQTDRQPKQTSFLLESRKPSCGVTERFEAQSTLNTRQIEQSVAGLNLLYYRFATVATLAIFITIQYCLISVIIWTRSAQTRQVLKWSYISWQQVRLSLCMVMVSWHSSSSPWGGGSVLLVDYRAYYTNNEYKNNKSEVMTTIQNNMGVWWESY